ncbi:60S ribosomal protein L22 [Candidatus Bathyarchaeota archaeon]|jgi:hypothetical protein|nr:60S ribosomal protein L22 [Candidatus Bathyarchaeota archaeon]
MTEAKINISELKSEGSDVIKELTEFLKEKTKAEVDAGVNEITVKAEGKAVSRLYLRALLRKFLHRKELKDYFRVIGGKENTLIVKQKKIAEEE